MSTRAQTTSGYNVNKSTNYQRFQCQLQHKLPAVTMSTIAQTELGTTSGYNVNSTNRTRNYQRLQCQQQHKLPAVTMSTTAQTTSGYNVNYSRTTERSRGHWPTQTLLYPPAVCHRSFSAENSHSTEVSGTCTKQAQITGQWMSTVSVSADTVTFVWNNCSGRVNSSLAGVKHQNVPWWRHTHAICFVEVRTSCVLATAKGTNNIKMYLQ